MTRLKTSELNTFNEYTHGICEFYLNIVITKARAKRHMAGKAIESPEIKSSWDRLGHGDLVDGSRGGSG